MSYRHNHNSTQAAQRQPRMSQLPAVCDYRSSLPKCLSIRPSRCSQSVQSELVYQRDSDGNPTYGPGRESHAHDGTPRF
jgi:hypothetical protein